MNFYCIQPIITVDVITIDQCLWGSASMLVVFGVHLVSINSSKFQCWITMYFPLFCFNPAVCWSKGNYKEYEAHSTKANKKQHWICKIRWRLFISKQRSRKSIIAPIWFQLRSKILYIRRLKALYFGHTIYSTLVGWPELRWQVSLESLTNQQHWYRNHLTAKLRETLDNVRRIHTANIKLGMHKAGKADSMHSCLN